MFSRNNLYGGPVIITQGMRPHWLRLALLLLLIAGVILLPPIRYQPGQASPQSTPLSSRSPSDAELVAAIERANSAFRTAHEQANVAALEGVATGAWLDEERRILADLQASGTTEHWKPRSFRLISLVVDGATATACTDEEWELVVVDAGGGRGPAETRHHIEQYTLEQVEATWLVSEIEYDTKQCRV
jgi:hypothetical protein